MGQALYRKHRPKKLSDVVGQEHITKTLSEALKQGRISHAYLLTGPRGVGKTSIARILAHEINDLPYDDDSAHMDIIEIDAASNRRIDEIRDLRDKVHIVPTSAKYKVYIIDEVHMLTREAFNALLKTLEEPPAHVVFILATTDAHKLPETIVSRTQRYGFRPVAKKAVADHLATIAKEEKVKITPEALELLAEHGEGSFRDSISLLDQASSQAKEVELADVQRLLGMPPKEALTGLLDQLTSGSASLLVAHLNDLYDQGYQATAIAKQLGQLLRKQLIAGELALALALALDLLGRLLEVPVSRDPERLLEIVLLESAAQLPENTAAPSSAAQVEPAIIEAVTEVIVEKPKPKAPPVSQKDKTQPVKKASQEAPPAALKPVQQFDESLWPDVLAALKRKHNTLYGVVRMAQPRFRDDGTIELAFAFAFHKKRLSEAANRQKLLDTIQELTGHQVIIECVLDQSAPASPPASSPVANQDSTELTTISNIFGGGELLES